MADHCSGGAVVLAHREQMAGEVGQRGLAAGAAAVGGLVECDDRIAIGQQPR